jgi:cell division protein FtsQ
VAPRSPHWRRRLLALGIVVAALAAGYMFWLRDSSLVQVRNVTVTGLDTPDAARVEAKLTAAARRMTTLHVDPNALRQAVADEPLVQSLTVHADFPHKLTIEIVENRPVAKLVAGGREVAVAPDGTVLEGAEVSGSLPSVRVGFLPGKGRMANGQARQLVAVAGAAPPRLLARVSSLSFQNGRGAVAQLERGPAIYFGHTSQLAAKWTAAAGVLAQGESQGATFIDVRMPMRPVAGGLGLKQEPQAGVEAPSSAAGVTSPSVISAEPGAAPAAATAPQAAPQPTPQATPQPQSQQAAPTAPATPAQTAPPVTQAPVTPAPTNPQP